jgi:hypothetical protein
MPACPEAPAQGSSRGATFKCQSGFTTFQSVLLQEQTTVVLLLERALISWSLAMDERIGHQDLCGLGHQNVKPYVYERIELYCSSMILPVRA